MAFKLQNLRQIDSGKGLDHVSRTDHEVWAAFVARPSEVATLATRIREVAGQTPEGSLPPLPADEEFFEGRLMTVQHQRRERSPKLRRKLLEHRAKRGPLSCDACDWNPGFIDVRSP